ncbi:fucolectin-like [Carassius carassius]|uniref:fucolectin-like n=1 Tax=Carassius carassius TaxID=217509 RepID=UPI0028687BF1|nr:fucolectin-like [Carassius carassius]
MTTNPNQMGLLNLAINLTQTLPSNITTNQTETSPLTITHHNTVRLEYSVTMNLAKWGTAFQSTVANDWYAQNALDGLSYTCTHTADQTDPWWKLDLMKMYSVNRVTITNRAVCCESRINGAEIRVGNNFSDVFSNPVCAVVSTIPAGATYSYSCHGMEGRYVTVNIPGDLRVLTLCEVEVYGEGPLLKRTFLKLKLKSSWSLSDPAVRVQLLSQLQSVLEERGFSDVTLQWTQPPEQEVKPKEAAPAKCAVRKRR